MSVPLVPRLTSSFHAIWDRAKRKRRDSRPRLSKPGDESVSRPRGRQESGTRHDSSRSGDTGKPGASSAGKEKWNKVESRRDGILVATHTRKPAHAPQQ